VANYVSGVNPSILKWAREKAGYSIDEVARSLKRDSQDILLWEAGLATPTYSQLEKLAYSVYKRPIAVFFFPRPPEEQDPGQAFRTLPDSEIDNLLPDTRLAIREALAMQIALRELTDGRNPGERLIFRELHVEPSHNAVFVARRVREYLKIDIDEQFRWSGFTEALKNWRSIIQDNGIFVFKRSFKQVDISGFSLVDDDFPVIYLNNSTTKTRQIFSLFHELAHILLSTSGVTKADDQYINVLTGRARNIEVFCNQFAAEYLVPSDDFDKRVSLDKPTEQLVDNLATLYKVSREVILRKLLDRHMISQEYYESKTSEWHREWREKREGRKTGGNYYATQAAYLGERFLNITFAKYYEGSLSLQQLADYLSVKAQNVAGIEQFVLKGASAE